MSSVQLGASSPLHEVHSPAASRHSQDRSPEQSSGSPTHEVVGSPPSVPGFVVLQNSSAPHSASPQANGSGSAHPAHQAPATTTAGWSWPNRTGR